MATPATLAENLKDACLDTKSQASDPEHENAEKQPGPSKSQKKRRKKAAAKSVEAQESMISPRTAADSGNVLISRSKHLKYISSYHGNWLNLPPAMIEDLLEDNEDTRVDYRRLASEERRLCYALLAEWGAEKQSGATPRQAGKAPARIESPRPRDEVVGPTPAEYAQAIDQKLPPAVDKAAMRNVMEVRRLVDAATDLLTRASSGMTAAELRNMTNRNDGGAGSFMANGSHTTSRSVSQSPVMQARLRGMAIASLAQAFRIDEIATSVILMQTATPFEEAATRILRSEPNNLDAIYVMYFQERIPSRTLYLSTPPNILDRLVMGYHLEQPQLPCMYRSRGVLHLYRQDYAAAIRDFDEGMRICRLQRARQSAPRTHARPRGSGAKKKDKRLDGKANDSIAETSAQDELFDVGHAPGDDIGRQLLFSRGMAYYLWALDVIERNMLALEGISVPNDGLSNEGGELSLESAGLTRELGGHGLFDRENNASTATRLMEMVKPGSALTHEVENLLTKSLHDHELFQAYFPILEIPVGHVSADVKQDTEDIATAARASGIDRSISFRGRRLVHARALTGRVQASAPRKDRLNADPRLHMSYHPMLGETLFAQLLAHLLLGNFPQVLRLHYRATRIMSGLDTVVGQKPFFLLGRSLSHSQYHEVLERLSHSWLRDQSVCLDPVEEVIERGPIACLAHVAHHFTPRHEQLLFDVYLQQTRENELVRQQTKDVNPTASRILHAYEARAAPTGPASQPQPPAKSHAYGSNTTARAEIAVAWIMAARIHPLQDAHTNVQSIDANVGGSRDVGKGKGKGPA